MRVAASRTTANASGSSGSRDSPSAYRSLNSSVLARSSASVSATDLVGERLDGIGDLGEPSEDLALTGTEKFREHHAPSVGGRARRRSPRPTAGRRSVASAPVAIDPADPGPGLLAFLTERHLATLTTLRPDGSPHVVPVGVTYDAGDRARPG